MSQQLIDMLKRHEGVEHFAYECSQSKVTVGCGRNIDRDGGLGLSDDEIDYLLQNDIKRCREELNNEYTWFKRLDAVRQDAIIDLFFNLGATRFRQFKKAIGYLESDDYIMSAAEFLDSRWSQQVGYRAEEICEMIETGEYASV
jgi:lysozyme